MRFSGVVLPEGTHRDLYVVDGRVTYEPTATADTVVRKGFIVPGLVDAHCHVGLDADGAVDEQTQEAQARTNRDAGTLLIRDAGSAADTRWIDDRADLPRIIRAGRHIARTKRYLRNFGAEIEPPELVEVVAEQARRGDGWVKLVGDWIDRDLGNLASCWPTDVLAPAIAKAHELGARVTAHVFDTQAIPDLLAAGIDCIEHGTGLTPDQISFMASNRVALVPTRLQVENFPSYAAQGETRFPAYGDLVRRLYAGVDEMIRNAYEAGVQIYAGTDAGGVLSHGLIAREVQMLSQAGGLPAEVALGAAAWRAREWLGRPVTLDEGVPADFVVYETNPLDDLSVLAEPSYIVLRGRVVAGRRV